MVSTVTEGPLPPVPPAVAYPVWEHPAPLDPAWGPTTSGATPRPALSATVASVRWLAVGGHALIAGYVALSLVISMVAIVVVIGRHDGDLAAAAIAGTITSIALSAVICLWLASRTRRLWQTYDARRFLGALPGDLVVVLMMGASASVGAAGGQPVLLVLLLVAVPAGVALLTLAAALFLPRPLLNGP
jgi:hypothetical protein